VVVRVDVGDDDAADVRDAGPRRPQAALERVPGVVAEPPGVDQADAVRQLDGVDQHVPQLRHRQRDGDRPEPGADLLHGRVGAVEPGLALRRPGDLDRRRVPGGLLGGCGIHGAIVSSPQDRPYGGDSA
jgi:hypothetical protein